MLVQTDDQVPTVPVDDGAEPNGAGGESQPVDAGTDGDDGEDGRTPEPRDAHGWKHRVDKLTKQRAEAREELTAAKAELETLRGTVGDELVISAAQASGVLPEFIDKAGAQVLTQAAKLERDLSFFESQIGSEDHTFQVGEQTYTGRDAARFAATVRGQLRQVAGKAEAVKQKAVATHNELLELGKAAKKAGWKAPGKSGATAPAGRTPATPPPLPGEGGGTRHAPAREAAVPQIDYSKVTSREDLMKIRTAEARQTLRRAG